MSQDSPSQRCPQSTPTVSEAWSDERLPASYRAWRDEEKRQLLLALNPDDHVVDYGCGDGRIIPALLARCGSYCGCDIDPTSLALAKRNSSSFGSHVTLEQADCLAFAEAAQTRWFSFACCLGNTIASLPYPVDELLRNFAGSVSREVAVCVIAKGTLDLRLEYYRGLGAPFRVDPATETISSAVWGDTKAFSVAELEELSSKAGCAAPRISRVGDLGLMLWLPGRKPS